jgi:hypothetical protein
VIDTYNQIGAVNFASFRCLSKRSLNAGITVKIIIGRFTIAKIKGLIKIVKETVRTVYCPAKPSTAFQSIRKRSSRRERECGARYRRQSMPCVA